MRMIGRTSSIAGRGALLMLAVLTALAEPCSAQVLPPAPQIPAAQDGTDGPGFVRVPSTLKGGIGGFIDVTGYASCRYVTTNVGGDATKLGEVIPVTTLGNWQAWLSRGNTEGDTAVVCCRPKSVTMCRVGGAVPQTITLPYSKLGEIQQPIADCTDQWGDPYKDTQTWSCDETGSGVTADGEWDEQGSDAYQCAPNAFTSGCSASCPTTVGTTTTYDSCGNVQAVNACSISCCTPSYSKSCDTTTATYTDTSCGTGSYQVRNGCSPYSCQVGESWCDAGSRTTYEPAGCTPGPGCNVYYDCGFNWHSWGDISGSGTPTGYDCETDDIGGVAYPLACPPGAGVDDVIYMGTCYE